MDDQTVSDSNETSQATEFLGKVAQCLHERDSNLHRLRELMRLDGNHLWTSPMFSEIRKGVQTNLDKLNTSITQGMADTDRELARLKRALPVENIEVIHIPGPLAITDPGYRAVKIRKCDISVEEQERRKAGIRKVADELDRLRAEAEKGPKDFSSFEKDIGKRKAGAQA